MTTKTVDLDFVLDFVEDLGFDPDKVFSVRITHDQIEVVEFITGEDSLKVIADDNYAKKHTNIPITRENNESRYLRS